jgi:hypothetical protein
MLDALLTCCDENMTGELRLCHTIAMLEITVKAFWRLGNIVHRPKISLA